MNEPSIVVVDYHKGNLSSVVRGSRARGRMPSSPMTRCDRERRWHRPAGRRLVLRRDLVHGRTRSGPRVIEATRGGKGTPFLGICLGLQLLFERGDEGVPADAPTVPAPDPRGTGLDAGSIFEADGTRWVRGLAVLPGSCTRLESARLKVPHVGWDQVHLTEHGRRVPCWRGSPRGRMSTSPTPMPSGPTSMRTTWRASRTMHATSPPLRRAAASSAASSTPRSPPRMGTRFFATSCACAPRSSQRAPGGAPLRIARTASPASHPTTLAPHHPPSTEEAPRDPLSRHRPD